jgi:hypothetical protein
MSVFVSNMTYTVEQTIKRRMLILLPGTNFCFQPLLCRVLVSVIAVVLAGILIVGCNVWRSLAVN